MDKSKTLQALEAARHELVTLDGLQAADAVKPEETWNIDTSEVIKQVDAAIESFDTCNHPS